MLLFVQSKQTFYANCVTVNAITSYDLRLLKLLLLANDINIKGSTSFSYISVQKNLAINHNQIQLKKEHDDYSTVWRLVQSFKIVLFSVFLALLWAKIVVFLNSGDFPEKLLCLLLSLFEISYRFQNIRDVEQTHENPNIIESCFHNFTAVFIKTFVARTVEVINFKFSEVHLKLWCAGTVTSFPIQLNYKLQIYLMNKIIWIANL